MLKYEIRKELKLDTATENAFFLFVNKFSSWWPREYTWSQETLKNIALELRIGGRCYEEGPHEFICQFGRVLDFKKNELIKFTWQIGPKGQPQPDPKNASEITVHFIEKTPEKTILVFEHKNIENHGEDSSKYFDELNSKHGWDYILSRYVQFLDVNN